MTGQDESKASLILKTMLDRTSMKGVREKVSQSQGIDDDTQLRTAVVSNIRRFLQCHKMKKVGP